MFRQKEEEIGVREERGTWFLLELETEGAKSQRCVKLEINTNILIF